MNQPTQTLHPRRHTTACDTCRFPNLAAITHGTDLEDYPGVSLPLLRDMHPDITLFGRRGHTYVRQLAAIHALLDTHTTAPTPASRAMLADMDAFASSHDPATYSHYPTISDTIRDEQRPRYPYDFLQPRHIGRAIQATPHPALVHAFAIIFHPLFGQDGRHHAVPVVDFMLAFTHHSLNRDLLTRYAVTLTRQDRDYRHACNRWGIPT